MCCWMCCWMCCCAWMTLVRCRDFCLTLLCLPFGHPSVFVCNCSSGPRWERRTLLLSFTWVGRRHWPNPRQPTLNLSSFFRRLHASFSATKVSAHTSACGGTARKKGLRRMLLLLPLPQARRPTGVCVFVSGALSGRPSLGSITFGLAMLDTVRLDCRTNVGDHWRGEARRGRIGFG